MAAEVWIPIGLSCVMAIIAIITLARNGKKDTTDEAIQRATMTADVKYIRTSIDEIKVENKVIQKDIGDLKTKVVQIESKVDNAHTRIDDMMRKENEHG